MKPPGERSPASTGRRNSTVSRTFVSGRSNGIPFQRSTITFDEVPTPSAKRPGAASAIVAALIASRPGPLVKAGTIAVPSRSDGAHTEATASGVKASAPPASLDQASV